jgi:hypothetical protein
MLNAWWAPLEFELPAPAGDEGWRRLLDTALEARQEACRWGQAATVRDATYPVAARSIVLLGSSSGHPGPATARREGT